jgi:hypothetical protein
MKIEEHPTVQRIHRRTTPSVPQGKESLDAGWLKQLVLDAGADDVGFCRDRLGRGRSGGAEAPGLRRALSQRGTPFTRNEP